MKHVERFGGKFLGEQIKCLAMRILHIAFVLLGLLVSLTTCQQNTHQVGVDSDDDGSTTHQEAQVGNPLDLPRSGEAVAGLLPACVQDGNAHLLSAKHHNDGAGSPAPIEHASRSLQSHSAASNDRSTEAIISSQDEKKEEASEASPGLVDWFQRLVSAVDNAEEWAEVEGTLAEGRQCGYLDKHVTWDDDQYTPLHYAAEAGDLEVVQALIEKDGIPVDIRTGKCQRTPLHLAALAGELHLVKYLMRKKADWNAVDSASSNTLHYAALGTRYEANTAVVAHLYNHVGADLKTTREGFNLLHLAVRVGNPSLVGYLLEQCPALVDQEAQGVTPLAYAKAKQEASVLKVIKEKMVD